jgi:hypothetical protein
MAAPALILLQRIRIFDLDDAMPMSLRKEG